MDRKEICGDNESRPKLMAAHAEEFMTLEITRIVEDTMTQTFKHMFGQDVRVSTSVRGESEDESKFICTSISLSHGDLLTDFAFNFDPLLLSQAAAGVYSATEIGQPFILEDLGCEITNIVCSKVKAYLNAQGHELEMEIPYVDRTAYSPDKPGVDATHLNFMYNGTGSVNKIGISVCFMVLKQVANGGWA